MVTRLSSTLPSKEHESLGTDKSVTASNGDFKNLKILFFPLETNISYFPNGKSFKRAYWPLCQTDAIPFFFVPSLRNHISGPEGVKKKEQK
jgi:hypothetical protein